MKRHFVIFVIVFLVTIGFAAANTVLDITGNINVAENIEDFKIEITNLKINNNDSKTLISKDKQSFTFTGSGNDTLEYTVTNYSYQYDANISLICTPSDNITVEQISNLPAQSKNSKEITSTNTSEITCTINVEKISRTDYAENMCLALEGTEWTFDYTGAEQEFTVPCDGNYKIEAWGAQGGQSSHTLATISGKGSYTSGVTSLKSDNHFYLYVGAQGTVTNYMGAFNGGGLKGREEADGSGGGATDIRLITGGSFDSISSRIMVAAGGGGSDDLVPNTDGSQYKNSGGGLTSTVIGRANKVLYGATQTSGGYDPSMSSSYNGSFGTGNTTYYDAGSGGGGGYYGGGASDLGSIGGSSFISGHNGCDAIAENSTQTNIIHTGQPNHYSGLVFTDTVMVDGDGYKWTNVKGEQTGMPTHDGKSTMTGNDGNGYAKVTYLGK